MPLIEPLPYFPALAKALHGPTISLVLTYLEMMHPAAQDSPDAPPGHAKAGQEEPFMIDCDTVSNALGVSRRTLHVTLNCLGCWWSTETERSRAERSGREFLRPDHSFHDPVKCYSITGSKAYRYPHRTLAIRRNLPKLANLLQNALILPIQAHPNLLPANDDTSKIGLSVSILPQIVSTLPQILAKVMPDWGDRRAERWDRWRRETGKVSRNPGRMRANKIGVTSLDGEASDYAI